MWAKCEKFFRKLSVRPHNSFILKNKNTNSFYNKDLCLEEFENETRNLFCKNKHFSFIVLFLYVLKFIAIEIILWTYLLRLTRAS